jgi:hypothetical protein
MGFSLDLWNVNIFSYSNYHATIKQCFNSMTYEKRPKPHVANPVDLPGRKQLAVQKSLRPAAALFKKPSKSAT